MGKDCSLDSVGQNYNDHSISPILSEVMEELHRGGMSFPGQRNDYSQSQGGRNFGHSTGSIDFANCENIYEASHSSEPAKNSLLDKFDEVLLDIERAIRASDRGSARMARQWMHEAAADLQDLGTVLEPSSEASVAETGSDTCDNCQSGSQAAVDSGVQTDLPSDATEPTPESDASNSQVDSSKPVAGSIDEVLAQNDRNQNSVFPGENTDRFGWYGGRAGAGIDKPTTPDSRFNYLMAWNMVYPEKGKQANPDARVEMQNFRTYVHTKDGKWLEVLNQNNSGIGGGLSDADFADMYAVYDAPISNSEDGVASFKAPPPGFNFQPWINGRGGFDNQNIDGVYVSGMVRSDRPDSNLVIDQGADWYAKQDGTAVGLENSDGIGTSNWLRLSDSWQPLFYSTVSADELRRNPPPGITA